MPAIASSTPPDPSGGRRLGRLLVKSGKVTRVQLVEALMYQKEHGGLIGEVLVRLGFVQAEDVLVALTIQRGG